ncbi:MAG: trigger factor [Alphaproteobacteria bacterium]|nr:trigger factor [Alphaproteobacteria bacterium]
MQVVETNSESLLKDFKVTVDAADIEALIDSRLSEVGADARIPGFRPGKAPVAILKQRYGQAVRGEILETTLRERTQELLAERGLRPASQPRVEVTSFEEGSDLEYDVSVELLPDIGDVDFSTLELERDKVVATDTEINDTLQRLADQNKQSEPVETARAAKKGDIVVIDFVGKIDDVAFDGGTGNDIQLELGADQFIPGFEDQLVGSKAGDSLDVKVTFPDDYGSADLAGKDAVFNCDVKELRQPIATEINDEFAATLGLDSLDALKEAISGQLNGEYAQFTGEKAKRHLLDKLAEMYDFEVPPRMLEAEFEQIWQQVEQARENDQMDPEDQGKSEEELRAQYQDISARRVRLGLLLAHVGEANELTVTQEEVNRAIMEQARQMPGQEQQVVEFFRSNTDAQASLQAPIFEDKVVNFIFEMAKVTEREITPEQLRAETEAEAAATEDKKAAADKPKKAAPKKKAPAAKKAAPKAAAGGAKAKPKAAAKPKKAAAPKAKSAD